MATLNVKFLAKCEDPRCYDRTVLASNQPDTAVGCQYSRSSNQKVSERDCFGDMEQRAVLIVRLDTSAIDLQLETVNISPENRLEERWTAHSAKSHHFMTELSVQPFDP
jgi:hypothetical protein